jgi:hypothetical protein
MLLPAMRVSRPLRIDQHVCATWANNLWHVIDSASRWWNFSRLAPQLNPAVIHDAPREATALCFSGGLDSFYTLLRGPHRAEVLVTGIGYDVKLPDARRIAKVKDSVRAVAAEMGIREVFVTTNLREHDVFRAVGWERSHGGALAALGHLLSEQVGRLEISSSYPRVYDHPWGSRWDIDPYFSSAVLTIDHIGAELRWAQKLCAIAHEDLVRRHLRVCWQNLNDDLNCCRCEKCVRTMLMLTLCGQLERYPQFHGGKGLLEAIDRLPRLAGISIRIYESMLGDGLAGEYAAAVRKLLARSLHHRPALVARVTNWIGRRLLSSRPPN